MHQKIPKAPIILIITLLICHRVLPQDLALERYNTLRLAKERRSMIALGTWGAANLVSGAALAAGAEGSNRYFHLMNIGWGAVNVSLATLGFIRVKKSDPSGYDLENTVEEQHRIEKILLLNTGLDVGYMLGGLYLMERSRREGVNEEQLKGFGQSIIMQGAFLFAFDLTTFLIHNAHHKKLRTFVSNLSLNSSGIGMVYYF